MRHLMIDRSVELLTGRSTLTRDEATQARRSPGPYFEGGMQPLEFREASDVIIVLVPESVRELLRCRILRPVLRQLRGGVTPRRLAWSLALGAVIGINPTIGLTTLVVVLLAWIFGLNQIATQVGTHVVAPIHLLLFLPFIEIGVFLFHTRRLPLSQQQIKHLSRHPWLLFHSIWQWEWHALIVWGLLAAIAMPLLAMYLRRVLVLFMRRHKTLVRPRPVLR